MSVDAFAVLRAQDVLQSVREPSLQVADGGQSTPVPAKEGFDHINQVRVPPDADPQLGVRSSAVFPLANWVKTRFKARAIEDGFGGLQLLTRQFVGLRFEFVVIAHGALTSGNWIQELGNCRSVFPFRPMCV